MKNRSFLFLYTELAEYILACIELLSIQEKCDIHIIKWPSKNEAPFKFRMLKDVTVYNREEFSEFELLSLSKSLNPSAIITSGWVDKAYLKVNKHFHSICPTIIALDNHWTGEFSQRLKTFAGKYYFKSIFSDAWVPGEPQVPFAKRLGFKSENVHTGFYSADLELFKPNSDKNTNYNFLFVGRYLEFKGIFELWEAFIEFKTLSKNPWTLNCVGTGDLWEKRKTHNDIIHHGFLQPEDLRKLVNSCDVFILPSHKEPWGVVVHEMAASGLSLLCTYQIGAATSFLIEGENGYYFQAKNSKSLLNSLRKIDQLSSEEINAFSKKSISLSKSITQETWVNTLLKIAKG